MIRDAACSSFPEEVLNPTLRIDAIMGSDDRVVSEWNGLHTAVNVDGDSELSADRQGAAQPLDAAVTCGCLALLSHVGSASHDRGRRPARAAPLISSCFKPIQEPSRMDATRSPEPNLQQAVPFFAVSNMESSLRFYVDGLGFEVSDKWIDEGTVRWCRLQRGGAAVMLQDFRRDRGNSWSPDGPLGLGVSIQFICDDALSIYREIAARGLTPSRPCVGNGMWVTSLRDPDGYRVEFESQTDLPEDTWFDAG